MTLRPKGSPQPPRYLAPASAANLVYFVFELEGNYWPLPKKSQVNQKRYYKPKRILLASTRKTK